MKTLIIKIKQSFIILATIIGITVSLISCDKDKDAASAVIAVPTGVRLVHSSAISGASLLDLYVDDVKLNNQSLSYNGFSAYFDATSGSKKITVKTATGLTLKDTVVNIKEGHRYSFFVKEWQLGSPTANPPVATPVKELIITDDSNTQVPDAGKAKVRFVNTVSTGSSLFSSSTQPAIFLRVNPIGSVAATDFLTYNLTNMASDFLSLNAGEIMFRATVPNSIGTVITVNMAATNLEAGKLYTLYLVGSPGGTTTPGNVAIPSSLELRIIINN